MKKGFILVVVISLFVFGCGTSTQKDIDYRQGFLELSIDVDEIKGYENSQFDLDVWLQNTLGYNLENVEISILGMDETYIDFFSNKENIEFVEGKSKLFEQGGREKVSFEGTVLDLPRGIEKEIKNPYRIFVSYDSELVLLRDVCVPSNSDYEGIDDGGCNVKNDGKLSLVKGENRLTGQGAPIGISEAELIFRDQNVELRLLIENKKKGEVGTIVLKSASLGGRLLNCNFKSTDINKNSIEFDSEKKKITLICKGNTNRGSYSYKTPLLVELLYDYEFSIQEELVVAE